MLSVALQCIQRAQCTAVSFVLRASTLDLLYDSCVQYCSDEIDTACPDFVYVCGWVGN